LSSLSILMSCASQPLRRSDPFGLGRWLLALSLLAGWGAAQAVVPEPVRAALARAQIDADSLSLWVAPVGTDTPRLAHQADRLAHPASVMKLVTSAVALQRLGPTWQWNTGVYFDGPVQRGVLEGSLVLQGRGDPRLVTERLWLLLQRVRQLGVQEIRGDILLDRSHFALPPGDPGAFDGEPYRPYNVLPDALMLNQKSFTLSFRPDAARGIAWVSAEPLLTGVELPASVPLDRHPCGEWRAGLAADFSQARRLKLGGSYPAACGEKTWPVAYQDPGSYDARLIDAAWRGVGGRLRGSVREGRVPAGLAPAFEFASPSLAEVLRDMNKFSNNMVAQHTLLALSPVLPAGFEPARAAALEALQQGPGCAPAEIVLDNGSGRSREERITAHCLARVMQWSWAQPWMPELLASLPVAGVDGTARRAVAASGRAHVKTGSLANVAALAGWIHLPNGRRVVLVAFINHPLAAQREARAALDAVVQWVLDDKELNAP
jgi:D-alanyl-D-alanine carboxypeptidase/D-alanyl-D-alanine-endopeptidase (penicillin-binding protein 4)